jgi:hypothetical protein
MCISVDCDACLKLDLLFPVGVALWSPPNGHANPNGHPTCLSRLGRPNPQITLSAKSPILHPSQRESPLFCHLHCWNLGGLLMEMQRGMLVLAWGCRLVCLSPARSELAAHADATTAGLHGGAVQHGCRANGSYVQGRSISSGILTGSAPPRQIAIVAEFHL